MSDKVMRDNKPSHDEEEMKEKGKEEQSKEGVMVSEEFQQKAHELLHKATKHEVDHVHSRGYARSDEIRKEEEAKAEKDIEGKGKAISQKGSTPSEYSTADMPSD